MRFKNSSLILGFGCILIALANILISSSNFLFDEPFSNAEHSALSDADNSVSSLCAALSYNNTDNFPICNDLLRSSFAYCNPDINTIKLKVLGIFKNFVVIFMKFQERLLLCANNQLSHFGPTALIFFGLFILGIGRTMPFSLGLPLIDDNVKKRNLPIYFGNSFYKVLF